MSTDPATEPRPGELTLAAEFPEARAEQWRALVDGVLKGVPFDKKLVTRTYDDIAIQPLYSADAAVPDPGLPGAAPFVRGSTARGQIGGWDVRQYVAGTDPAAINDAILTDLERGATSIWLRVGDGGIAPADLAAALRGVYLDAAPIGLDIGSHHAAAVAALQAAWGAAGIPVSEIAGSLGIDSLTGTADHAFAVATARDCARRYQNVRALVVDGLSVHHRGASDVEELGVALAAGVAYLRTLTADDGAAIHLDDALDQIEFRLSATSDQFATIAKFRAARRLWGRIAQTCGASGTHGAMRQHAVTSRAMMTKRDPWVNILRTTVAAFAAGVAGADVVTVLPFDDAIGTPDRFARRIARNTHALLSDESNLTSVIDPAGGSWYVESLTDEMAQAAWTWFQQIEAAGGCGSPGARAAIEERIGATRDARAANIARRRDPITGVSEFPNLAETPVTRPPSSVAPVDRYAAPFEAVRDRSDALAATGRRPAVFLACLGPLTVHSARATFAKNFFESGGIEALDYDGSDEVAAVASAFRERGAPIAVICSSDKVYETHAEAAARALKAAGAARVYLAGNPGDRKDIYQQAGVDEFIFIGCDVVDILTRAIDTLTAPSPTGRPA